MPALRPFVSGWFAFDDVPLARADPHLARFIAKLRASPGSAAGAA